jgi:hypothetical protein
MACYAGLWAQPSAITSIKFFTNGAVTLPNTQPPPYTASRTPKKGKQ